MVRSAPGSASQNPSDEALVAATRTGDRDAYKTLVERYQSRIFSMAFDIVKNREDAEDVVQESFVKAFLSLDKFKGESSFFTWLYRIAFNMAVDVKRKSARRGGNHFEYKESLGVSPSGDSGVDTSETLGAPAQHVEGPHEALARKQAGQKIQAVLRELSEDHRAVITLREIDGLNYEEIAEALDIPRGTVMSRLFYARKALQKALREFAPEGAPREGESNEETATHDGQRLKKTIG
jgi:RNA polymerase sigma-70 factor (ECF subfamily)